MHERAREILLLQRRLRAHSAVRIPHTRVFCDKRNNRIARLPASAHFPAMTAAAVVRRPGGWRPSRRADRVVVTRRSLQGSGIDDGSRFGKLFISILTFLMGGHTFLLLQVSVAAKGLQQEHTTGIAVVRLLSMIICLHHVFLFYLLKLLSLLQAFMSYILMLYYFMSYILMLYYFMSFILMLYYKCYITK